MSIKYRADIDGLRGVAVMSVILFHINIPGFSGGFVGVDVFFVISGFLITSIILKDIRENNFSIARFYERRIRRIFPPLFPVIAFIILLGGLLFDAKSFKELGQSVTATTIFSSNILFWKTSGYFDSPSLLKPLLHTWSLGVEEQFYILFPLLLIVIKLVSKGQYFIWLFLIAVVSLIASIWGIYAHQVATFYLVPTRAWELLSGSILSLGVIPLIRTVLYRNILSFIGMGLIIYSVSYYTDSTIFPGYNAILPVLGANLIIYTGICGSSFIKKMLSLKPIVFIGLISYSLYLWHWPLIVFTKYILFHDLAVYEKITIIVLTFIISTISLRYIEQPFRGNMPVIPNRNKLFVLALIVMIITSFLGILIDKEDGMPYRYPAANAYMSALEKNDSQWIDFEKNESNIEQLSKGKMPIIIGALDVAPCFAIWGDSHARALTGGISELSKKYGLSGFDISHGHNCRPLIGIDQIGTSLNESIYNQGVIDYIKSNPNIKTVIIAANWSGKQSLQYLTGEYSANQSYYVLLRVGLMRSVKQLLSLKCKVVIVSDVPELKDDPKKILWFISRFGMVPDYHDITPSILEYNNKNKDVLKILTELSLLPEVTIIHPSSMLFDDKNKGIIIANNKMLYIDSNHLSLAGSERVAPLFNNVFAQIASFQ